MSPFKSQAQRRKFGQLVEEGKITKQKFNEWNKETGSKKLPERVTPKVKSLDQLRALAKPKTKK